MPLLDHFRPPLEGRRRWESFFLGWSSAIIDTLNQILPADYFAEVVSRHGPRIETDESVLDVADMTLPATFPPEFGVRVYGTSGGTTLVAAIELVSPGNKDRDETRRAFAAKCATYIQQAIGLVVIDVVTSRHSQPFAELMALVYPDQPAAAAMPLAAVSYRPVRVNGADSIEVRFRQLTLGQVLPALPLALGGMGHVMVDLETTYQVARGHCRV